MSAPLGSTVTAARAVPRGEPRRAEADQGTDADRDAEGFYAGDGNQKREKSDASTGPSDAATGAAKAGVTVRDLGPGRLDVTV
ncbi:MAG: hypothetical protein AAF532_15625 [Planctomycetota bacterium]